MNTQFVRQSCPVCWHQTTRFSQTTVAPFLISISADLLEGNFTIEIDHINCREQLSYWYSNVTHLCCMKSPRLWSWLSLLPYLSIICSWTNTFFYCCLHHFIEIDWWHIHFWVHCKINESPRPDRYNWVSVFFVSYLKYKHFKLATLFSGCLWSVRKFIYMSFHLRILIKIRTTQFYSMTKIKPCVIH